MDIPGLVINLRKDDAFKTARQAIAWFEKKQIKFFIEKEAAAKIGRPDLGLNYAGLRQQVDYIILFGGDGTFLHTSHYFIGSEIPLVGINIGKLGFLTDIETEELAKTLQMLVAGDYSIESRMMLRIKIIRRGKEISASYALNDLVVNRGANSRMIKINLFINAERVSSFRADGLIISTPTGSTAYSLSAGGPIINPRQVRAILITPICPHNLYLRPMVISENEKIRIEVADKSGCVTTTSDGKHGVELQEDDQIIITAADREISIIKFANRTFYSILKEKMSLS